MRDVTYIAGKDHAYTVHMPNGVPFIVEFRDGVGGHYPAHKAQAKPGQATKKKWVKGIPDEVAEAWEANMQPWGSGFVIEPEKKPVKKKAK